MSNVQSAQSALEEFKSIFKKSQDLYDYDPLYLCRAIRDPNTLLELHIYQDGSWELKYLFDDITLHHYGSRNCRTLKEALGLIFTQYTQQVDTIKMLLRQIRKFEEFAYE